MFRRHVHSPWGGLRASCQNVGKISSFSDEVVKKESLTSFRCTSSCIAWRLKRFKYHPLTPSLKSWGSVGWHPRPGQVSMFAQMIDLHMNQWHCKRCSRYLPQCWTCWGVIVTERDFRIVWHLSSPFSHTHTHRALHDGDGPAQRTGDQRLAHFCPVCPQVSWQRYT